MRAYGGWCHRAPTKFTHFKPRTESASERLSALWQSTSKRLGPMHPQTQQLRDMYARAYEAEKGRKPF